MAFKELYIGNLKETFQTVKLNSTNMFQFIDYTISTL